MARRLGSLCRPHAITPSSDQRVRSPEARAMGESDPGTQELVELIRVGFDRWANGDLLGTVELFAEDCELKPLLGQVEGVTYRGHEGVRRWFTDVHAHWSAFRPQLYAFREGDGSLLAT